MDITQLLHDEIIAHRDLQIGHPELLPWIQERIDALYPIKQVMDHTPQEKTPQAKNSISRGLKMGKSTEQIDPSKPLKSAAQEQFCLNISKGMEQGPAYRAVPAYKSKDPDQAASSLIRIPKVAERIRYLRDQVCKIAVLDRSYVVRGLMNVADTCGQHIPLRGYRGKKCLIDANGANGALDKLAKIEGSYERDNDQKNKGWDDYLAWLNSK